MLKEKSPMREAEFPMNALEAISLAGALAIVLVLFCTIGIDRELERREASEQWFYCNIKKEC